MAIYITAAEANQVLQTLVSAQTAAFDAQQKAMEALNAETLAYVNKTRDDVDKSLRENKTSSEALINQEIAALKEQTQTHVSHVEGKVEEMRALLLSHDSAQAVALRTNEELVTKLEKFAAEVNGTLARTQAEVLGTQAAITALIDSTRADGSSNVIRSGNGGERDRQVFDVRDYKIEPLPTQFALGAWKKWRHEVEIYIDTIGPSWRGVKLLLQQARHSPTPLEPDRESMGGRSREQPKPTGTSRRSRWTCSTSQARLQPCTGCSCPSSTST